MAKRCMTESALAKNVMLAIFFGFLGSFAANLITGWMDRKRKEIA